MRNLRRMFRDLVDMYWTEAACDRVRGGGAHRCHQILYEGDHKLCPACLGFVRLKESRRLLLGDKEDPEMAPGNYYLH